MNIFEIFKTKAKKSHVKSDLKLLDESKHMFNLLSHDPYSEILNEVQKILNDQVEGAKLITFDVVSSPEWLTGAIPDEKSGKSVISRSGVAFSFSLIVEDPKKNSESLSGVYSWVARNMNEPEKANSQIWFDINGTLQEFGAEGMLKERIYLQP